MTESDADFFFGRGLETTEVIGALAAMPDKIPILLGNSGVGKSSLAQAGVLAALMRQGWPETVKAASPATPARRRGDGKNQLRCTAPGSTSGAGEDRRTEFVG